MTTNDTDALIRTLGQATPWDVYANLSSTLKIAASIALLAAAAALVMALIRMMSGGRQSGFLGALGVIGLVVGIIGALYGATNSYIAAQVTHPRLLVLLPSIIECAYVLLFGLLAWLIAKVGNAGARRS